MAWYVIIGLIAAGFIAIFTFPQLYFVVKTKNTSTTNLWMYLIFVIGVFLFFILGILLTINYGWLDGVPLIIADGIATVSGTVIVAWKLSNMSKAKKANMKEKQYCETLKPTKSIVSFENWLKKIFKRNNKNEANEEIKA